MENVNNLWGTRKNRGYEGLWEKLRNNISGQMGEERGGKGADVPRSYLQGTANVCYNKDNMIKLALETAIAE